MKVAWILRPQHQAEGTLQVLRNFAGPTPHRCLSSHRVLAIISQPGIPRSYSVTYAIFPLSWHTLPLPRLQRGLQSNIYLHQISVRNPELSSLTPNKIVPCSNCFSHSHQINITPHVSSRVQHWILRPVWLCPDLDKLQGWRQGGCQHQGWHWSSAATRTRIQSFWHLQCYQIHFTKGRLEDILMTYSGCSQVVLCWQCNILFWTRASAYQCFPRKSGTTDLFRRVLAQGGCEVFVLEDLRTWLKSLVTWSNLTAYPTFSKRWDYRFPKFNSNLKCPIILEKCIKHVDKESSVIFFSHRVRDEFFFKT